jgi:2-methylaconitate cis-trans-isomerase PrpF
MAVTGAQCLASCVLTPGTVAQGLSIPSSGTPALVAIEHPSGSISVTVDFEIGAQGFNLRSAGLVRTARLLAKGEVMVPGHVWSGHI